MKLPPIKLPKLGKKEQVMVGVILAVAVGGFYKKIYRPMNENIATLAQDLDKKKGELKTLQEKVSRLDFLEQKMVYLREQDGEALRKLPRQPDIPGLIRLLNNTLKKNGLLYSSIGIGQPTSKDIYNEITVDLAVSGTFQSLGNFLTAIGQSERIVKSMTLTITPKTSLFESLASNFKLVTYTSK